MTCLPTRSRPRPTFPDHRPPANRRRAALVVAFALSLGLLVPALGLAQTISCGPADGPGKKLKATVTDSQGNKYKLYCVDGAYFKGEWELVDGTPTFCFGKCTFPGGENCYIFDRDENGRFSRVVLINVAANCGPNFHAAWQQRDGETKAEQEARVRQYVEDNGCNANIYSINFSPYLQVIDVYMEGQLVESFSLFPDETMMAYNSEETPYEALIEDPSMHTGDSEQSAFVGEVVWDDFEDGVLAPRYSVLTGRTGLAETNGSLVVTINEPGDGISIDVLDLNPSCAQFDQMDISPFPVGLGVAFETVFENGDSLALEIYQVGSVRVKVVQKVGPAQRELRRTFEDYDVADISKIQIDWLPGDKAKFEITTKDGTTTSITEAISALHHDENRTREYRITGLDITFDPTISIGSMVFSDQHLEDTPTQEVPTESVPMQTLDQATGEARSPQE